LGFELPASHLREITVVSIRLVRVKSHSRVREKNSRCIHGTTARRALHDALQKKSHLNP
jgi:hypothetical protein